MSWSFRKIFNFGPIRTTLSKGGVGMSWGFSGFRVGVSANGRKYITMGILSTGLHFTKYLTSQNSQSTTQPTRTNNESSQQEANKDEPWWKQKNL